jgi:precorrin-3B C17-methyltransferase
MGSTVNSHTAPKGRLSVVGLGPGNPTQLTPEAEQALAAADILFGYGPYLARIPERPGQQRRASDNREELARAQEALTAAAAGARVAMVSGGDPGVYGMAAAVCEAIEHGPRDWRELALEILPGITAMLAFAARVGAPLGHDFCAISLSDNLKPWEVIERRLEAAARGGFVIAFYNPTSRQRPWQLGRAFQLLAQHLPGETPVVFGHAIGRADEKVTVASLRNAAEVTADMSTCIIVGSAQTRVVDREGSAPLIYTPRSMPSPNT